MGSDATVRSHSSEKSDSKYDDSTFMLHESQFATSLKDLKNLREQLYSAAEYFESSYDKDGHKQFVVESSKTYVAKAIVSTVDHLGSVADKLNKFLDKNANEFSATGIRVSCVQQRLRTFEGFTNFRGISQHLSVMESPGHHKHYIFPATESFASGKPEELYKNCVSCPPYDGEKPKLDNSFSKAFHTARRKPDRPLILRKQDSKIPSREQSPNPHNFSFTRVVPNKETGWRSISPLRFTLNRSGTVANRSVSPSPSHNKNRWSSEPRRAISACRRRDVREIEVESYTRRSKHLFKALIGVHRPKREINSTH